MTVTACGSCDNCHFFFSFNLSLNASVHKQPYRRRVGHDGGGGGGGGECGNQGEAFSRVEVS